MHRDLAQFLLIAAIVAAGLVILVPLVVYLMHKLFFFDWPPFMSGSRPAASFAQATGGA